MVNPIEGNRLSPQPSHLIDTTESFEFEFDGRRYEAHEGDTIISALYASGIKVIGRSFKYHRARGILCAAGRCPNCLMTVDGVPNVRACTERVSHGMVVSHQNAWPGLNHDAMSVLDRLDKLMPVGFYYKTFYKPKFFWHIVQPIIRRAAGLGKVNVEQEGRHYRHKYEHADLAIVGGGPAGMSTALAAAGPDSRVVLIDDQPALGGSLQHDVRHYDDVDGVSAGAGYEIGRELAAAVAAEENVDVMADSQVFGLYEGNLLGILSGDSLVKMRAKKVVIATGSYEQPLVFDGNDTPGVMLSTAMQRMVHMYGVRLGSKAVVGTANDQGYYAALDLLNAGVRIAALADSRPDFPDHLEVAQTLQSEGVFILTSNAINRAEGHNKVIGAVASRIADGKMLSEERQFDCDLVAMSGGFQPAAEMLHQAGATVAHDDELGETVPIEMPEAVLAAGDVTGIHDLRIAIIQGRLAGLEAVGGNDDEAAELRRRLAESEAAYRRGLTVLSPPIAHEEGAKKFICYCEDVTAKEIGHAVEEGFEDIQTLKRYTTTTMGPCQGKMCHKNLARLAAEETGRPIGSVGATTQRQPIHPVSLGALAGPSHLPVKLTSADQKHRDSGAQIVDVGLWQRPYSYGSVSDEAVNVRQQVGLIDVSTLGKLDVQGKDAGALLDKVYTHYFSNLRRGRIRYGLLCGDNGTILDDGTVTRMADDRYFVTTSTANIDLIEEWFKWWMAGTGMCAHITNITPGLAAFNVAGPRARETLAKLTDVDLSPKAFRYMRAKEGKVAGVDSLFLRIGFVGEAGWEIHFPAEYGEYIWDAVLEAGEEFGIAPFGTEAQRVLRLEKAHIIPSQDTDLTSNPLGAHMDWTVKLEKEDFIGRAAIAAAKERGLPEKLVGFVMKDGGVPADGVPIMSGDEPIGRVTSSRQSPVLGKGFGLAWVPVDMAVEGNEIQIRVDGKLMPGNVTLDPVYDPDGEKLRS